MLSVHKLPFTAALLASVSWLANSAQSVEPYSQATVTRLQNKVLFGDADKRAKRPAQSGDVVKAENYLLTETDSRAELKYPDGSIVRIGQNTVFTFEAQSRTLTLEHGSLLFYIPKGQGGGTVKTASMTAAITGTIGKVADNMIAILEGEVTLVPSGIKVPAGFFAVRNADGTISVNRFDPQAALGGKLMDFGGPIANFDEGQLLTPPPGSIVRDILEQLELPDRMQNHPGAQELFNPTPKPPKPKDEKKDNTIIIQSTPRRTTPRPSPLGGTLGPAEIPRR